MDNISRLLLSKELRKEWAMFVVYPDKVMDSISKYKENMKIMTTLTYLVGASQQKFKDMWDNMRREEGFENSEMAKEFMTSIMKESKELEQKGEFEMSNIMFLVGLAVVHNDNMRKNKYWGDFSENPY